ncbi:hypothetical protein F4677DRAFT_439560 [Hypoxylon crocopeplum]|nr:hypothetical protein F4677DRAFT_439560 [Hypoxylon crocopeplum]
MGTLPPGVASHLLFGNDMLASAGWEETPTWETRIARPAAHRSPRVSWRLAKLVNVCARLMYTRYTCSLFRCASIAIRAAAPRSKSGGTRRFTQDITSSHQRSIARSHGRRPLTSSAAMASSADVQAPQFSAGVDVPSLTRDLDILLASAGNGGRWELIPSGEGLERSFKFKTFAKTWVYNTTYIRWTTHDPKGLSAKDVELATLCDGLARDFGEIVEDAPGGGNRALKQVADRAATKAGDCCTPKKQGPHENNIPQIRRFIEYVPGPS